MPRRLLFLLMLVPCFSVSAISQSSNRPINIDASARTGESLFAGSARLQNSGPACAACHSVSGLPFPNGGSLGPDLTRVASKLGDAGLSVALQTLYFPTMRPIFDARPLTAPEQRHLKAFLSQAQGRPLPANMVPFIAGIAAIGLFVFLALTWGIWRHRLQGTRKSLVKSASAGGGKL